MSTAWPIPASMSSSAAASRLSTLTRAGVGVGTLYQHFPTKEALLNALVSERLSGLAGAAEAALRDPDSWAVFRGMVWRMVEAAEDRALLKAFAPPAQQPPVPPLTGTEGESGGPPRGRGAWKT